jgi:hypothetical protein
VLRGFPILLLETNSNGIVGADERHMQVQAACLICLGNALLHSLDFFVKAMYIDLAYRATEYTFYQTDSPDGHTQMVIVPFIAE